VDYLLKLLYAVALAVFLSSGIALYKLIFSIFKRRGCGYDPLYVFLSAYALSLSTKLPMLGVAGESPSMACGAFLLIAIASVDLVISFAVYGVIRCFGPNLGVRKFIRMPSNLRYGQRGKLMLVCVLLCWTVTLLTVMAGVVARDSEFFGLLSLLLPMLVLSFPMLSLARKYLRYARIAHECERTLSALGAGAAPILLLRSFQLDQQVGKTNLDEELCRDFSQTNVPVISLCDPDEDVPSGGSIKLRARDDGWKDMIRKLLPMCRAVVMFEGVTDGLNWEVDTLRSIVPPERFFIATPPEKYRIFAWLACPSWLIGLHRFVSKKDIAAAYEFVWGRFRSRLSRAGIVIPEKSVQGDRVIVFGEDWQYRQIVAPKKAAGLFGEVIALTERIHVDACDYGKIADLIRPYEVIETMPPVAYERVRTLARRLVMTFLTLAALLFVGFFVVAGVAAADAEDADDAIPTENAVSSVVTTEDRAEMTSFVRLFDPEVDVTTVTNGLVGSFCVADVVRVDYCIVAEDNMIREWFSMSLSDDVNHKGLRSLVAKANLSSPTFGGCLVFQEDEKNF